MSHSKKKAFLYVGHSNWGKSFTLKQLTRNNSRLKHFWDGRTCYKVRKSSNDDDGKALLKFVEKIPYSHFTHYVLTFCPIHKKKIISRGILYELSRKFDIYFFVPEKKYSKP